MGHRNVDIWEWALVEIHVFGVHLGTIGVPRAWIVCAASFRIKYFFVVIIFLSWIATPAFGAAKPRGFASSNYIITEYRGSGPRVAVLGGDQRAAATFNSIDK